MATKKETALIEIVLKGQAANASIKDMDKAVRGLSAQLKGLPKDSQAFADKKAEFQKMSKSLKDLQNDVKGVGGVFQSIGKEIKGFGILAAGYLGFDWLTSSISGIIKNNAALSDSLADIRKTTGMTEAEARKLNTAFGQIDTRTAAKELRNIAIVGGQLGIAKGDIFGFTVAVDKMNVALGDEFTGGAEEVTKAMGGLRNVFTDIKTDKVDQDLLHIGNAINELASSGAATGPVVSDFANRIGGVGITLGLTSGQVLGLSATLQELNVSTERGGTAVTKILQKMTQNTGEFAKVAGIPVKEFTEMVNKDLYGAFVKVVEGSKKGNVSATEFGKTLDSLGVDGAGASEVFAKLGSNTGLLNEKVGLANTSLKGTSSIMNEFNMKNQTLGADLEKIGKGFSSWFSNSTFSDGLKALTSGLADLFDKTPEVEKLTDAWRNQKGVVDELQATMSPLLTRHDELKKKTTLNKDEQTELDNIIAKVAETIPYAVTEFDKYGKAMDINTAKGREFLNMENQKLELMNKDALTARRLELIEYTKEITNFQEALKKRDKDGDIFKTVLVGKSQGAYVKDIKLTNKEIIELNQNLLAAKDKQLGVFAIINELTGKVVKSSKDVVAAKTDESAKTLAVDEETKNKLIDNYTKLLETLKQLEHEHELNKMSSDDRELQLIHDKYKKLRTDAKGHSEELKRIQSLEDDDIFNLLIKKFEKEGEAESKGYYERLDRLKKLEKAKAKILDTGNLGTKNLSEDEKFKAETAKLTAEFDNRIAEANAFNATLYAGEEAYFIDVEEITKLKNAAIEALNKEHNNNLSEDDKKANKKRVELFKSAYGYISDIWSSIDKIRSNSEDYELKKDEQRNNEKKNHYKRLLNAKVISQRQFDEQINKINEEQLEKENAIKRKQEQREKRAAIIKATINTAVAVAEQAPNYILMALTAALGALQIGVIASQPSAYAKGGFNRISNDPQGYTQGATLYTNSASGKNFIAGEEGEEWISPSWMVNDPVIGPNIAALENIRVRGFAAGGSNGTELPVFSQGTSTQGQAIDTASIANTINTLNSILEGGIIAYVSYDHNVKTMSNIDKAQKASQFRK